MLGLVTGKLEETLGVEVGEGGRAHSIFPQGGGGGTGPLRAGKEKGCSVKVPD